MKKLINYFKNVKVELTKVTWPSAKETRSMAALVLIVTLIWAAYVWLLDLGFGQVMQLIIKK